MPDPTPLGPPADSGSGWISPQNPTALGPPADAGAGVVTSAPPTALGPPADSGSGWTAAAAEALGPPADAGSGWTSPPRITSLSPDEVPTTGATVTVTGTALDTVTDVTVDGTPVTFTPVDATTLTFDAPPHAIGTVDVVISAPSGSDTASLLYYAALTVSSLSPTEGPTTGGTLVTLTGSGFTGIESVTFDGIPGTSLTFVDDTSVTVLTPAHATGPVDVVVTNSRDDTSGDPAEFTYVAATPTITAVNPDEVPVVGAPVTITGTALSGVTTITIGGASVSFVQVSDTEITFTAPPHAIGTYPLVLTTALGSDTATITYYNPCRVLSVSPSAGSTSGGTVVTVTGTGFTGATGVDFGGAAGTSLAVISDSELQVRTPAHAAGVVDVRVSNTRETSPVNSPADQFTYRTAPTITSMSPTDGPASGGTAVTLTGTALDTVTTLLIGTAEVEFTATPTSISFTTPGHAPGPAVVLALDANDAGASPPTPFTFYAPVTVTDVSPATGGTTGGNSVRVTGTGFLGATAVAFGATPATSFVVNSDTQITAVAPAQALGTVDVRVTTPRETSPINSPDDEYTYVPAPTITSVTPDNGSVGGGTLVTIVGTNFYDVISVTFGGKRGSTVTVVDPTTITVRTPTADAPGEVDVVVTTPAAASAPGSFTYTNLPPVATASATPTIGQAILTVQFSGIESYDPDGSLPRLYHWDFGDGTESTAITPSHQYTRPGTYTATLTVTDAVGSTDTDTVEIVVLAKAGNSPPVARATADPVHGDAPLLVTFDGSASSDPDGSIVSYEWNFGDGTASTDAVVNHVYNLHDTYVATLTVTDDNGERSTTPPIIITVDEPIEMFPPEIAELDPREGSAAGGTAIHVNGSHLLGVTSVKFCIPGEDDGVEADFFLVIDDNTMLVVTPPSSGVAIVNVRASNRDYMSVPGPQTLFVYRTPPIAVIDPEYATGDAPLIVPFSSAGSYSPIGPISYFWRFGGAILDLGNAAVSYEPNPVRVFSFPGSYPVTLTVTDRRGITATAHAVVVVTDPPAGDPGSGGSDPPWGGGGGNGGSDPGGSGGGGDPPPGGGGLALSYNCEVRSQHLRKGASAYDPFNDGKPLFTEEWSSRRIASGVQFTVTVTVLRDFLPNPLKPQQYPARVFFGAISITADYGNSGSTASRALVLNPRVEGSSGMTLTPAMQNGVFAPLINGGNTGILAGQSFTISGVAPDRYDVAFAQVGFLSGSGVSIGDTSSAWVAIECDIEAARRINGWTVATDPAIGGNGWTLGQHATVQDPHQRNRCR